MLEYEDKNIDELLENEFKRIRLLRNAEKQRFDIKQSIHNLNLKSFHEIERWTEINQNIRNKKSDTSDTKYSESLNNRLDKVKVVT